MRQTLVDRQVIVGFIMRRLESMSLAPRMWASSQDSFVTELVLLAEVSHLGTPEHFKDRQQAMMAELCGPGSGSAVPTGPITQEWAEEAVIIARKYVIQ